MLLSLFWFTYNNNKEGSNTYWVNKEFVKQNGIQENVKIQNVLKTIFKKLVIRP